MKLRNSIAAVILLSFAMSASAQKFMEGDKTLSFLKGEKNINLVYTYDNMLVGKDREEDYKKRKTSEYNAKQKGKGDRWAEKWVGNRALIYEPMFEELLTKVLQKGGINVNVAKNQADAKYTIELKTKMTEPGFNAVVMKVNPSCDFDIVWKETATGKVVAMAELNRVQGVVMGGSDYDFDPANKIKECYAKAGKVTGKAMLKALK